MRYFCHTLRFFNIYLRKKFVAIDIEEHTLLLASGKEITIDVYTPHHSKPRTSLFFTHGMNKHAFRDPRIIEFCKALSTVGYQVIVPLHTDIQSMIITAETTEEIVETMDALLKNGFCIHDRLATFCVSFAGALVLRAITHPAIRNHVSAYLSIGSPSSYESSFRHALRQGGASDVYARVIFLRNLFRSSKDADTALDTAFQLAIDDAFEHNNPGQLLHYEEQLPTPELKILFRTCMENVMKADDYLTKYADVITHMQHRLDNSGDLNQLKCPVALIHSEHDKIFSTEETQVLYNDLKQCGVNCRMLITSLLDHVTQQISIRQLKKTLQLMNIFAFFFKHANKI